MDLSWPTINLDLSAIDTSGHGRRDIAGFVLFNDFNGFLPKHNKFV